MTDEAYVFNQTNRDRAIVRRSASHRKCGSKSKKCKLGVDYMSKKQIEQQHGECKTWKLTEWYSWEDFKQMPQDIQIEYINRIMDEYKVGLKNISIVAFHLSENALRNYCSTKGFLDKLNVMPFNSGIKVKRYDIERLRIDVNGDKESDKEEEEIDIPDPEPVELEVPDLSSIIVSETETMEFSTSYISNAIDYEALKKVEDLFGGKRIRVAITIEAV